MQTRFVTTGILKDNQEVWLAYSLNEAAFRLDLYVVGRRLLTPAQVELLQTIWVSGGDFDFPEGTEVITPDLNSDSILPDHIRSDKTGEIRHKQNEWAIELLTNKIWESYIIELERLKQKAITLAHYDKVLFDETKSFWERVLDHKKERNITQERLDNIKDEVNHIFERLKEFRKTESVEFERNSTLVRDVILTKLEEIKKKAEDKANFKALSEEIKALQAEHKGKRFSRADEVTLRKAYDDAFHYLNEQRTKFFSDKFEGRLTSLREIVTKIEKGLERDRKDLEHFVKKADSPKIMSLELQLLKVRIRQLKETIKSKEEKVNDIHKTMEGILRDQERTMHRKPKAKADEVTVTTDSETVDVVVPDETVEIPSTPADTEAAAPESTGAGE